MHVVVWTSHTVWSHTGKLKISKVRQFAQVPFINIHRHSQVTAKKWWTESLADPSSHSFRVPHSNGSVSEAHWLLLGSQASQGRRKGRAVNHFTSGGHLEKEHDSTGIRHNSYNPKSWQFLRQQAPKSRRDEATVFFIHKNHWRQTDGTCPFIVSWAQTYID